MNDYQLDGNDGPPAKKDNPEDFRGFTSSAKLRQEIYRILAASPKSPILLSKLREMTGASGSKVYRATRMLVMKGLANRTLEFILAPTKRDPSHKSARIGVAYVQPWTGKSLRKW